MKRTVLNAALAILTVMLFLPGCSLPQEASEPMNTAPEAAQEEQAPPAETQPPLSTETPLAEPTPAPTATPSVETDAPGAPDGRGTVQFTIVLHLEGWDDGAREKSFRRHAEQLRAYADLFERYGATMSLEAKEIIDGCINWDDNVLLELQRRGHAVGIHADAGGERSASVRSIARTLDEMQTKLASLEIKTSFASGTASKANWVEACEQAGIDTVSCMVAYGLWSLDPALRPDGFEPYKSPSDGHDPYPFALEERVRPWLMDDGSNWIIPDPEGSVLLIPTGLSLNGASEELSGERVLKSELMQADIDAWREALPRVIAASDSGEVNTFYAVWSFGSALDMDLLEDWLKLIDEYVQAGSIRWSTIPEMAELYRASLAS